MVARRTGQPPTPYSVYIKGKKWKDFADDDHAEAVANKLRAKFKQEGRDPSVITVAPTNMSEEQKPAGWGEFPPKQEITIVPPKKLKSGQTYQDQNKYWQSQGQAPIYKTNEDNDPRAGMAQIYRRLAPKIERYKDSFLAGQLYDELENYAELHGAEREFKQMMATARGRAHMEYDTNPGGFHNWFWFLPFEDEVDEGDISQLEKAVADAPVEPIANMEESFESKIHLQGVTDQKLLEAARKIDTFSRSYK
jgi:hypothetical protein